MSQTGKFIQRVQSLLYSIYTLHSTNIHKLSHTHTHNAIAMPKTNLTITMHSPSTSYQYNAHPFSALSNAPLKNSSIAT